MSDLNEVRKRINAAWDEEGSIGRLGLRPAPSREIQEALIPPGGNWTCTAAKGATTRSIFWNSIEAALINPRGQLADRTEGEIAMGMCAMPVADKALRSIFILARDPANCDLICQVARAAIAYIERPAPQFPDEEDEGCPKGDPDCDGPADGSHDACETPRESEV